MKLFVDILKTIIIAVETIIIGILALGNILQYNAGMLWQKILFAAVLFLIIFAAVSWISKKAEYWDIERSLRRNSCRKNRNFIKWIQKNGLSKNY